MAIIGGGMMGIAAAINLAKSGRFHVTLFEKESQLGGLSSYYQWQDIVWDRFYHVILSTDTALLALLRELHLDQQIFWQKTKTGLYGEDKLVSLSSSVDFLTFPLMSLWQKCRMVLGILYSTQIKNPSKLDQIYVRQWLTKVFGRRVYEQIWDPLLKSKLGDARERTSAAFIWATITRLYGARSSGNKQEKMGHVYGGYHMILTAAEKRLSELGVTIVSGTPVLKADSSQKNGSLNIITKEENVGFDRVLFTIPSQDVLQLLDDVSDDVYWQQLRQIEYLGVVCVLLILTRKLSPYYVINLLDKDLPFTGIIEATNVVAPEMFGEKHLVYLPKYVPIDDPIHNLTDDQILKSFIEKLQKVFPDLQNGEILHSQIFRGTYVQPLQQLNYLDNVPDVKTPLSGVYLVNTSMIYNSTLNNNAVVSLAAKATDMILNDVIGKE
jgi:protoporphyrinogen oxidase